MIIIIYYILLIYFELYVNVIQYAIKTLR